MKKEFSKLLMDHLAVLAEADMAKESLAPKIDREYPVSAFDLVVTLIEMGDDEEDQAFLRCFSQGKLNVEDPFHWWQLLHDLIMFQKNGTAGRSRFWTEEEQDRLVQQCVNVGLRSSPVVTEISRICQVLFDERIRNENKTNLQAQISRYNLADRIKRAIADREPR